MGLNKYHDLRLRDAAFLVGAGQVDRAKSVIAVGKYIPALGKQKDVSALCLNLHAYLDILSGQEEDARAKIDRILGNRSISSLVKSLAFQREADLNASWPEARQTYLDQAEMDFQASYAEIDRRGLWLPLAYFFYGTAQFKLAVQAFSEVAKDSSQPDVLFLYWLCTVRAEKPAHEVDEVANLALNSVRPAQKFWVLQVRATTLWAQGRYTEALVVMEQSLRLTLKGEQKKLVPRAYARLFSWKREAPDNQELVRLINTYGNREGTLDPLVGSQLAQIGDFHCANQVLEELPQTDEILRLRGALKFRLGEPETALWLLSQTEQPDQFQTEESLTFLCYLEQFELDRAREIAETSQDHDLLSTLYLLWLGDPTRLDSLPRTQRAPTSAELQYYGDFNRLIHAQERVSEAMDDLCEPYQLARRYLASANLSLYLEQWGEAVEIYRKYRPVVKGDPQLYHRSYLYELTCRCRLGEDRTAECVQVRNRIEELFGTSRQAVGDADFALANAAFGAKKFEYTVELADQALRREKRAFFRALLVEMKGQCYLHLREENKARECFAAITQIAPKSYLAKAAQEKVRTI